MTAQTRAVLKSYFQRGLRPTQGNYGDLIDSFALISTSGDYVQKSGDTMTGTLILYANPTAASPDLQAASKRYVDAAISSASFAGGSNGQIQYNNGGFLGGFTVSGDAASLSTTGVLTLANTGVSAGTYAYMTGTVDSKGRITSASPGVTPTFSKSYESSQQTITSGGSLTLAHGLGARPTLVTYELVCNSTEAGYTTGDRVPTVPASTIPGGSGGSASQFHTAVVDSTNVNLRFGSATAVYQLPNFSTGNIANLTNSNWRLIVRAYV